MATGRDADGDLVPIRWTGFEQNLKDYQGELVDKNGVQERIEAMLDAPGNDVVGDSRWEPMRAVAKALIDAATAR